MNHVAILYAYSIFSLNAHIFISYTLEFSFEHLAKSKLFMYKYLVSQEKNGFIFL